MNLKTKLTPSEMILAFLGVIAMIGGGLTAGLRLHPYFGIAFGVLVLICIVGMMKLSDKAEKQRALSHMAGRPALSEKEFGKQFFSSDRAEIAAKLREILSRHIPVDLSQMQPNDRFVQDLRMDALDSMSTVEYIIEIEKEFGIKIPDSAAEKMLTFQSVVDYVTDVVKAKAS